MVPRNQLLRASILGRLGIFQSCQLDGSMIGSESRSTRNVVPFQQHPGGNIQGRGFRVHE